LLGLRSFLQLQLAAASNKAAALEKQLSTLRSDHNLLLGRLSEVTGKWQATVAQNQQLHQHNGNLQAQLADAQQQLAMLQREFLRYKTLLQQQADYHLAPAPEQQQQAHWQQ
jgi:predicted nuclease with TOPRIM domain